MYPAPFLVPAWVEKAKEAVDGPLPKTPVGAHCTKPYGCPFMEFCWPNDTDYPVAGLGGGKKKLGLLVMNGYRDIRDVPSSEISGQIQEQIHRVTRAGLPGLSSNKERNHLNLQTSD